MLVIASGISAILATAISLLRAVNHVVSSRSIFGATTQLFNNILGWPGVSAAYESADDIAAFRSTIRKSIRLIVVESTSSPLLEMVEIEKPSIVVREGGILRAADNLFCTPALWQSLMLGVDIVLHSATRYFDGQEQVPGNAICCGQFHYNELLKFSRTAGPKTSPFNAWVILKRFGALKIRMLSQFASALVLVSRLEPHPGIARVFYPGLRLHQTSTKHGRVSHEVKAEAEITESLLMLAVGPESVGNIYTDSNRGLL